MQTGIAARHIDPKVIKPMRGLGWSDRHLGLARNRAAHLIPRSTSQTSYTLSTRNSADYLSGNISVNWQFLIQDLIDR